MSLSARAVALQGFGFGAAQITLHGLLAAVGGSSAGGSGGGLVGRLSGQIAPITQAADLRSGNEPQRHIEIDRSQLLDASADAQAIIKAADAQALITLLQPNRDTGYIPPRIVLPSGRVIEAATASEDDMALLMFAMFVAMDD